MEELVREYRSQGENVAKNFFSNLGMGHVIIIGICLLILVAVFSNEEINPRYNYVIMAVLVGFILVLFFKSPKEKRLLSRKVVIKIAQEEVNKMVRDGKEFSYDSKVIVGPACHLKYENDMMTGTSGPIAWDVGFMELVKGSQYKKEGVISLHPFEGIITGFDWRPLGYTGRESRDRDIVPVGIVEGSMKTTDFGKENRKTG